MRNNCRNRNCSERSRLLDIHMLCPSEIACSVYLIDLSASTD